MCIYFVSACRRVLCRNSAYRSLLYTTAKCCLHCSETFCHRRWFLLACFCHKYIYIDVVQHIDSTENLAAFDAVLSRVFE